MILVKKVNFVINVNLVKIWILRKMWILWKIWKMWIWWKIWKMWIWWKNDSWKVIFEKMIFLLKNVIFVKNMNFVKNWPLTSDFWKNVIFVEKCVIKNVNFLEKCDFEHVNFLDKLWNSAPVWVWVDDLEVFVRLDIFNFQ